MEDPNSKQIIIDTDPSAFLSNTQLGGKFYFGHPQFVSSGVNAMVYNPANLGLYLATSTIAGDNAQGFVYMQKINIFNYEPLKGEPIIRMPFGPRIGNGQLYGLTIKNSFFCMFAQKMNLSN